MGANAHYHEDWQLVWTEEENEESIGDAIRRLTGFSLPMFKQAGVIVQQSQDVTIYLCGEYKLKDFKHAASEIYKKVVR